MTHPEDSVPYTRQRGHRRNAPVFDSPEKIELFAQAVADGLTHKELAALFECHEDTVAKWKKDPRVKNIALKSIKERVLRVTRKVDAIIEQRLQEANELDTETLLKVRKEFLGGMARTQTQDPEADDATVAEAQDQIEKDPEFVSQLQEFLNGPRQT